MIVISQIGKQSVGKSFLFNNMFKTKFLNQSGRCTVGVNMSFREINNNESNNDKLLILDTEGLGSTIRAKIKGIDINFDRVMVLFCMIV